MEKKQQQQLHFKCYTTLSKLQMNILQQQKQSKIPNERNE